MVFQGCVQAFTGCASVPIFINQTRTSYLLLPQGEEVETSRGRRKKHRQNHLASMRAGNSVTLRMCVVILPAVEKEKQVASRWSDTIAPQEQGKLSEAGWLL